MASCQGSPDSSSIAKVAAEVLAAAVDVESGKGCTAAATAAAAAGAGAGAGAAGSRSRSAAASVAVARVLEMRRCLQRQLRVVLLGNQYPLVSLLCYWGFFCVVSV